VKKSISRFEFDDSVRNCYISYLTLFEHFRA